MKKLLAGAIAGALLGIPAVAQYSYPGCRDLQQSDFTYQELFNKKGDKGALGTDATLIEPMQFALHGVKKPNGDLDHVDIYFNERGGGGSGAVKHYDGATHKVTVLGHIAVSGSGDSGFMGMSLDPGFDQNHVIYVWYVPKPNPSNAKRHLRMDRVKLKSDLTFTDAERTNMLDILGSTSDHWHTGGPMVWDVYGDLWIAIGNNSVDISDDNGYLSKTDSNTSAEWGPSNTANMRGGFIRIHPLQQPGPDGKWYSIPSGNFGEFFGDYWEKKGRADLAAQYRDPKKVLPEVYVKGDRSNYSIAVHPTKRWLAWGTVNYQSAFDEYNIVGTPAFTGFPYYHSHNLATPGLNTVWPGMTTAAPFNKNPLSGGVQELPPATPSEDKTSINTSIGGPIYVFDPSLNSDTKFPPQMHNTWITFGWKNPSRMFVMNLDTVNIHVTKQTQVAGQGTAAGGLFEKLDVRNGSSNGSLLGGHYGPDGALYILNFDGYYNSAIDPGITRIDYVGPCKVPVSTAAKPRLERQFSISLTPDRLVVREAGRHEFSLFDISGQKRFTLSGEKGAEYSFAKLRAEYHLQKGVHVVSVKTAKGEFVRDLSFL